MLISKKVKICKNLNFKTEQMHSVSDSSVLLSPSCQSTVDHKRQQLSFIFNLRVGTSKKLVPIRTTVCWEINTDLKTNTSSGTITDISCSREGPPRGLQPRPQPWLLNSLLGYLLIQVPRIPTCIYSFSFLVGNLPGFMCPLCCSRDHGNGWSLFELCHPDLYSAKSDMGPCIEFTVFVLIFKSREFLVFKNLFPFPTIFNFLFNFIQFLTCISTATNTHKMCGLNSLMACID